MFDDARQARLIRIAQGLLELRRQGKIPPVWIDGGLIRMTMSRLPVPEPEARLFFLRYEEAEALIAGRAGWLEIMTGLHVEQEKVRTAVRPYRLYRKSVRPRQAPEHLRKLVGR